MDAEGKAQKQGLGSWDVALWFDGIWRAMGGSKTKRDLAICSGNI